MDILLVKYCPRCNKILLATSEFFHRNRSEKDGFQCWCKICFNERKRRHYKNNIDNERKKYRKYYKNNKDKRKESTSKYRKKNKEKLSEYSKKYRRYNKEDLNKYNLKYREINKEKINEDARKYNKEHPEIVVEKSAKRRAIKLNQTPILTQNEKQQVISIYKKSHSLGQNWQVDHIKSLSKGGLHHPNNLQIVTKKYNLQKGSKLNFRLPLNTEVYKWRV